MEKEADDSFAIHVAVVDDAIIVTMPGTTTPLPSHKHTFRARAYTAANDKARELR